VDPGLLAGELGQGRRAEVPLLPHDCGTGQTAKSRPKTPFWTHISNAVEAEVTNALTGTKSAKKALADATSQVKTILSGQ